MECDKQRPFHLKTKLVFVFLNLKFPDDGTVTLTATPFTSLCLQKQSEKKSQKCACLINGSAEPKGNFAAKCTRTL